MIEYIGKCIVVNENGKKILVIGDLHIGYEASLNASGIFVTRTLVEESLKDIEEIYAKTGEVNKVILLGDLKHTFGRILKEEWDGIRELINLLRKISKKIIVIKGNHDVLTDIIADKIGFEVKEYYIEGENAFIHGDKDFNEIWEKNVKNIILGHIHPAVNISDSTKTEKYKCFLEGEYKKKKIFVVPSFISANEGTDPRDFEADLPWNVNLNKFKVIVIGENLKNFDFGKLENIK